MPENDKNDKNDNDDDLGVTTPEGRALVAYYKALFARIETLESQLRQATDERRVIERTLAAELAQKAEAEDLLYRVSCAEAISIYQPELAAEVRAYFDAPYEEVVIAAEAKPDARE